MTIEDQDPELRARQRAGVRRVLWICAAIAIGLYIAFIVKMFLLRGA